MRFSIPFLMSILLVVNGLPVPPGRAVVKDYMKDINVMIWIQAGFASEKVKGNGSKYALAWADLHRGFSGYENESQEDFEKRIIDLRDAMSQPKASTVASGSGVNH